MEHMMTFMDPLALIRCRLVSKYWRQHANKPLVENEVLATYERIMKSVQPLNSDNLSAWKTVWLQRPKYPSNLLLRDRALAIKHGKQLLEIDAQHLSTVIKEFNSDTTEANKYIIKSVGTKNAFREQHNVYFYSTRQYQEVYFQGDLIPNLDWDSIRSYGAVDIMFDLVDYYDEEKKRKATQKVYSVRERNPIKYFGFVPLDQNILLVLGFIFAPLIVHDVLNSAFLPMLKTAIGPLAFLFTCLGNLIMIKDFLSNETAIPLLRRAALAFIIGYFLLTVLTIPYCMNYFGSLGVSALVLLYVVLLYEYTFPWNVIPTLRRAVPGIIGLVLIIAMNDWKVTVDSFRNGVIWFRLFDHTISYALFCLHLILLNCLVKINNSNRWEGRHLIAWEEHMVKLLMKCYGIIVFITLYGLTWK
jgi:hypothetical protein